MYSQFTDSFQIKVNTNNSTTVNPRLCGIQAPGILMQPAKISERIEFVNALQYIQNLSAINLLSPKKK
jgi:hypothetical protein